MTDMTDEELIAFIRANKDRIKGFVEQEIPELMEIAKEEAEGRADEFDDTVRKTRDDIREKAECIRDEVKDFIREEKEAYKDDDSRIRKDLKEFTEAITNKDVQRHFIRMGMEFMMGMSALIEAMPKPEFAEDVMDKASDLKKTASQEYCSKNQDCPRRTVKKIELE